MRRLNRFERGIEDLHGPGAFRRREIHMDLVQELPVKLSPMGAIALGGFSLFWVIVLGAAVIGMAVIGVIAIWTLIFG